MHRQKESTDETQAYNGLFYSARQALRRHATGGNILILATALAMIAANVPGVRDLYSDFWMKEVRLQVGSFNVFSHAGHPMSVLTFINDALMAVFFFSIGLEIKREVKVGELSSFRKALLPIIGAVGGMVVPVAVFSLLAHDTPYAGGAAIPMATDIAFSLGVLAMLGRRVPVALKIFLTTLAVVDDIGGIIVIAVFYSGHIEYQLLIYAAILLSMLYIGGKVQVQSKAFYAGVGAVVWFLFLNSGIHPTIAGVLVAFCVPSKPVFAPGKYIQKIRSAISHFRAEDDETLSSRTILSHNQLDWLKEVESASDKVISPLQALEDSLHPVVNYFIVPLFAFANAGIFLLGFSPADAVSGVSLAVMLGLVLGKFIGILSFAWIAVKTKAAPMPTHTDWHMMASAALLGGIGFTVSLFIATLTFGNDPAQSALLGQAKLGIVIGSLISGTAGFIWLHRTLPTADRLAAEEPAD